LGRGKREVENLAIVEEKKGIFVLKTFCTATGGAGGKEEKSVICKKAKKPEPVHRQKARTSGKQGKQPGKKKKINLCWGSSAGGRKKGKTKRRGNLSEGDSWATIAEGKRGILAEKKGKKEEKAQSAAGRMGATLCALGGQNEAEKKG